MKIMFTMMSMQKGGAERVIANLSNYMISNNEIVLVPMLNETIQYKLSEDIKVRPINKKNEKRTKIKKILAKISLFKLHKLKKIIVGENPDIIIAFLPEPSFKVLALKKLSKKIKKIPTIVSVRNDPVIEYKNKIINFVMRKLYPLAEGFVFQTEDAKNYFDGILNCKNKIIVNPVGENFIKERYKGVREKRIVAVGRLEPQKNHKLLIEAFKEVYEKHPDYILEIYGKGSLEQELKKQVNKLGLEKSIIFKGNSDSIDKDIYIASAFVMTSNYEGMPNSLLEAFVLGVPCISTDCPCGGPKYIIKNRINGILVAIGSKDELINSIEYMIKNPEIADQYSKVANKDRENYKIDKVCKEWEEFIKNIKIYKEENNEI